MTARDLPFEWDLSDMETRAIESAPEPPPPLCVTCGLAPKAEGDDDCNACVAAFFIHEDPEGLARVRRIYAGTRRLQLLESEIARQLGAPISCGSQA